MPAKKASTAPTLDEIAATAKQAGLQVLKDDHGTLTISDRKTLNRPADTTGALAEIDGVMHVQHQDGGFIPIVLDDSHANTDLGKIAVGAELVPVRVIDGALVTYHGPDEDGEPIHEEVAAP